MLIDWFTVCAQAANFLILVWLLKRFLYQPVLVAIAAREKLVADQLQDAAAKKAEAQKERDNYQRQQDEFDRQRTALMNEAVESIKTERQKMLVEARRDAEALRLKLQDSIQDEYERLNGELMTRARREVFAITRKVLADLSGVPLEESLAAMFVRRLRELNGPPRETLVQALKTASEPACLHSVFDLPPAQQTAIQNTLNEMASAAINIRFERVESLLCGIELVANGQKLAWNMNDYLDSLERSGRELLNSKKEPAASTETK